MKNFFFFNEKKNYFTKKVFLKTHKCLNTNKKNKNNLKKKYKTARQKKRKKFCRIKSKTRKMCGYVQILQKKKIIKRARERERERE